MPATWLRAVTTFVLLFHGVGHAMGIIPALKLFNPDGASPDWLRGWSSRSWLLTDLLGDTATRVICVILFLAALVGFIGAALGLYGWLVPHELWRTLAVVSSVISLVAIALFWNALIFFFPHKLGYIGVDIAVLVCLLLANWPDI